MIPFMDLDAQYRAVQEEIDEALFKVIHSYKFINGPDVEAFERNFALAQDVKYCVGCSSGTAGLHLAFEILGLQPGDEVLVPTMTFIATSEALRQVGARPVFVDIDPVSYNLDPAAIEHQITSRTRAIVAVHLHGNPCAMEPILAIAQRYQLKIIEDCAQAHLAEYRGQKVGNFGAVAVFSFYPGKNLGAYGDAGALMTNDAQLAERAALLANHGRREKYVHLIEGYNYRLDTLQAAVLNVKLRYLPQWTRQRIENARLYHDLLCNLPIGLPEMTTEKKHVFHIFAIVTDRREKIIQQLREHHVAYGIHYPLPLHRQPAYASLGDVSGRLPVAEKLSDQFLSLPMYAELQPEQIEFVCNLIKKAF